MNEMPNCPAINTCQCFLYATHGDCVCGTTEKALRAWCNPIGVKTNPMTAPQREWCLSEIDSVEDYRREDYATMPDELVANGVLVAWMDYCRDKGLL